MNRAGGMINIARTTRSRTNDVVEVTVRKYGVSGGVSGGGKFKAEGCIVRIGRD